MKIIEVRSTTREELIDITSQVKDVIQSSDIKKGLCLVYIPHTTAGITVNENADPSVKEDLTMTLDKIVPDSLALKHLEGNSPAHVKASLIGSSVQLIIEKGHLLLGTWQGIFVFEFDGPRKRKIFIEIYPFEAFPQEEE